MSTHLTVGEVAEIFNQPAWRIRRAVDALGEPIPRVAGYRLVPRSLLPRVGAELERRGWLKETDRQEVET